MGRFVCPFTSIYEISEMVILARTFTWGEGDRTERVRKLLILYICVTIYALWLQLMQWNKASQGTIKECGEDMEHLCHCSTCLALSKWHPQGRIC